MVMETKTQIVKRTDFNQILFIVAFVIILVSVNDSVWGKEWGLVFWKLFALFWMLAAKASDSLVSKSIMLHNESTKIMEMFAVEREALKTIIKEYENTEAKNNIKGQRQVAKK